MPSRNLNLVWGFIDVCLLLAGVGSIVFALVWRGDDLLRHFLVPDFVMTAAIILGSTLLVSFAFSIFAILQRKPHTSGHVALNVTLVINSIIILAIGSSIWFFSLQETKNYRDIWLVSNDQTQQLIQTTFSCCGYDNSTLANQGCPSTTVVRCAAPLTKFADYTINQIFSSAYGFMAITLSLFLASLCQINQRIEEDRFRRIDEKRGGKGFV